MESYEDDVARYRQDKDHAFRVADWSPIPADERSTFGGLAYYPVDARYRLVVPLESAPPQRLELPVSTGGVRVQTRIGTFRLALPDGEVRLAAYVHGDEDEELFVPFRDRTSGNETYGAGRYLEARPAGHDRYVVDLNLAYHPYCAYNEGYACPLPPPENWLQVPIRAGERLPAGPTP